MAIILYLAAAFIMPFVLFGVQLHTGLDLMWIEGIILSLPAFLVLCRTLRGLCLLCFGRTAMGEVKGVRGRDFGILQICYTDASGNKHEIEASATYGIIKRKHPPEKVILRYFQRAPKQGLIGWRGFLYWLPTDLLWIALTGWIWYLCMQ